jgi:hypothetical protein
MFLFGGRALDDREREQSRAINQTPNAEKFKYGSQAVGAKLHGREGKSPDRRLRSPNFC